MNKHADLTDMAIGTRHQTQTCGALIVKRYDSSLSVLVEFTDTGYQTTTSSQSIRLGRVRDRLYRSTFGIGYIGIGSHQPTASGVQSEAYAKWASMMARCYSGRYPQYVGCTVDHYWHNFQNFADWYSINRILGQSALDKDIKIPGNRIYGPDTCTCVSIVDNAQEVHQVRNTTWVLTDGTRDVIVDNQTKFADDIGSAQSRVSLLCRGKIPTCKGWKLKEIINHETE